MADMTAEQRLDRTATILQTIEMCREESSIPTLGQGIVDTLLGRELQRVRVATELDEHDKRVKEVIRGT